MTASATLPPSLNSHEQALARYRSISKLALVALALGLASALVLITPLLAFVPLLAVASAWFSLRVIRASGGQILGRSFAVAGLCLATFFLGWGLANRFSRALTLESHARQVVENWLKLIAEGDLQQADQLRKPAHARLRSAAGRKEFYEKNPDALTVLNTFFATPSLREFIAQGANVEYHFDSLGGLERSAHYDRVTLVYVFGPEAGGADSRPLVIAIKRERDEDQVYWQIENVTGELRP